MSFFVIFNFITILLYKHNHRLVKLYLNDINTIKKNITIIIMIDE